MNSVKMCMNCIIMISSLSFLAGKSSIGCYTLQGIWSTGFWTQSAHPSPLSCTKFQMSVKSYPFITKLQQASTFHRHISRPVMDSFVLQTPNNAWRKSTSHFKTESVTNHSVSRSRMHNSNGRGFVHVIQTKACCKRWSLNF